MDTQISDIGLDNPSMDDAREAAVLISEARAIRTALARVNQETRLQLEDVLAVIEHSPELIFNEAERLRKVREAGKDLNNLDNDEPASASEDSDPPCRNDNGETAKLIRTVIEFRRLKEMVKDSPTIMEIEMQTIQRGGATDSASVKSIETSLRLEDFQKLADAKMLFLMGSEKTDLEAAACEIFSNRCRYITNTDGMIFKLTCGPSGFATVEPINKPSGQAESEPKVLAKTDDVQTPVNKSPEPIANPWGRLWQLASLEIFARSPAKTNSLKTLWRMPKSTLDALPSISLSLELKKKLFELLPPAKKSVLARDAQNEVKEPDKGWHYVYLIKDGPCIYAMHIDVDPQTNAIINYRLTELEITAENEQNCTTKMIRGQEGWR